MSELPKGWIWINLNQLVLLLNGDRGKNYPSKSAFCQSGVPFINAGHLVDGKIDDSQMNYISKEHFDLLTGGKIQFDDILYCIRGSLGKIALITDSCNGAIASSLVIIRSLENSQPKYIYYFLISPLGKNEIYKYDNGSAQPNLSAANVGSYLIPLPPLNEQRRIVAKLDSLLARTRKAREELEKIGKLCDRYKQAVLSAAFRGDLTADWRAQNCDIESISIYRKNINIDIDREISNSNNKNKAQKVELNIDNTYQIPDTWIWILLNEVCTKITDGEHITPPLSNDGVPLLSAKDVRDWHLDFSETKFISEEVANKCRSRCNPEINDILVVSRGATIGRTCRVTTDKSFCLMGSVLLFKIDANSAISAYMELFFKSSFSFNIFSSISGASAQQAIYIRDMKIFPIPIPPLEEQKEIVRRVEKLFKSIDATQQETQKALKLCDRLEQATLAKAFRGELVPQDPDDEPASVLLERIAAEKPQSAASSRKSRTKTPKYKQLAIEDIE